MNIPVIDLKTKKKVEDFAIDLPEYSSESGTHLFYLVNKYQRAAERQGTAATLNRAKMTGGGAKPYKQKGTGRARRGTNRSPLRRGGAVIFGPQPRDYSQKLNQKLVSKAIGQALSYKKDQVQVLKTDQESIKTKDMDAYFSEAGSILLIIDDITHPLFKATRNLPNCYVCSVRNISLAKLLSCEAVALTEGAAQVLKGIRS